MRSDDDHIIELLRSNHIPLRETTDLQPLFDSIGDANVVMLGEASHGTHEYYTWRAYISKRLIEEKGFNFIAVEGDWPDCYEINRYIKNYPSSSDTAPGVLNTFDRWPTWMWANWEIAAFIDWLKKRNITKSDNEKIGFYGLDVYSLWESMEAIINYLQQADPASVKVAMEAYNCFEPHKGDEGRSYSKSLRLVPDTCEGEVVKLLSEIRSRMKWYGNDPENAFNVEQNALVAVNAERYYRSMLLGGAPSWNVRDTHMVETLERLMTLHGPQAKAIVWEHNTHVGDSRATDMTDNGMYNIGELARKNAQMNVFIIGFGSYEGSVIAGKNWGGEMEKMDVPKAIKRSWENYLHSVSKADKLLMMDQFQDTWLSENHVGHRAIGVVYNPVYERYGNYVPSLLPHRYDAFIYLDKTEALHPLYLYADVRQAPDTFPFGE